MNTEATINIKEGNKLIAEFAGMEYGETYAGMRWVWPQLSAAYATDALAFNSEWSWLMPVLQKIERKGFIAQVTFCLGGSCQIWNNKGNRFFSENNDPIKAAWETVVHFIEWHNSNPDFLPAKQ